MPSPIGHSLMACSLYADRSPVRRRSWWTLAAIVLFANAPDLDFIPGLLLGQPLLFHRSMTHSLMFPAILGGLAFVVFACRGRAEAGRVGRLVFFATLSHVALDFFCAPAKSSGVMLFWPFSFEKFAAETPLFPLISHHTVLSWANVLAAIGESAIMSIFLLMALLRRWLSARPRLVDRRRAPVHGEPVPAYSAVEVGE